MREIKFRAWDKVARRMFHVDSWDFRQGFVSQFGREIMQTVNICRPTDETIELMQFTGEIARDKKEVYEGDIIEYRLEDGGAYSPPMKGVVKFCLGRFECPYGIGDIVIFKVLGNIYENPELLK